LKNLEDGAIPSGLSNAPSGIEHYDFFFNNNGTLDDLYSKADKLLIPFLENQIGGEL
jgi:hypothetical protein